MFNNTANIIFYFSFCGMYRVLQIKEIPYCDLLISQQTNERIGIFVRKFMQLFLIHCQIMWYYQNI